MKKRIGFAITIMVLILGLVLAWWLGWFSRLTPEPAQGRTSFLSQPAMIVGANYPWYHYGQDFGTAGSWKRDGVSQNQAAIDHDFAEMEDSGVTMVRWFVFCDGRSGLQYAPDGSVQGLDPSFFDDMDAALEIAQRHHVKLVLVLVDYTFLSNGSRNNGVQSGGRGYLIEEPSKRRSLIEKAFKPVFQRYGQNDTIVAWEVINEPEWAFNTPAARIANLVQTPVKVQEMQAFVRETASYEHKYAKQALTVGSVNRGNLSYWVGLGLDFYQYHYYPYMAPAYPFDYPQWALAVDKPCIIGEYPTTHSKRQVFDYLDSADKNGYPAAFAWSFKATDRYTDFKNAKAQLKRWSKRKHP